MTTSLRRAPELRDVLAYRNARVVRGFLRDYRLERSEANMLFREMLKLLWLMATKRGLGIRPAWKPLDDMWHSFMLHSVDYHAFCERFFGTYLHHYPATELRAPKPPWSKQVLEWESDVDLVFDALGPATATLWFEGFFERYTPSFLDQHRKTEVEKSDDFTNESAA